MTLQYVPANLIETNLPNGEAITFDVAAFDDQIAANGVGLVHYRALPCPIGLQDNTDSRKPDHSQHASCSNGFIYKEAGLVHAFISNAGNQTANEAIGRMAQAYAIGTFGRFYYTKDGVLTDKKFTARANDRFFIEDKTVLVPIEQIVQSSAEGFDKLDFQAEKVDLLVDAFGIEHKQDIDFVLVNGFIQWLKPLPFDNDLGVGTVYSVRYLYRPFWMCTDLMHELRFANQYNTPTKQTIVMPQQLRMVREQVFLNIYKSKETVVAALPKENQKRLLPKPQPNPFGSR